MRTDGERRVWPAGKPAILNRGIGMSGLPMRINCRPDISGFMLLTGPEPAPTGAQ